MQLFINMPSCQQSEHPFLQEMLVPQPVTWLAGVLLLIGIVLLFRPDMRSKLAGQALIFGGMLLGAVPVMNRMMAAAVDCTQPEQLARLSSALPIANALAVLVLTTCVAGVAWTLWRLKGASDGTAA